MFQMAIKLLWAERKKAINLCMSISITMLVCIVFSQFLNNLNFKVDIATIESPADILKIPSISFSMIILCSCLLSYSYDYYSRLHSQEVAMLKLSGYNPKQVLGYQCIQISLIIITAFVLAFLCSLLVLPLLYKGIYIYLQIDQNIFFFSKDAIFEMLWILLCVVSIIIFLSIKHALQTKMATLFDTDNIIAYKTDRRALHIPNGVFMICYGIGLLTMYVGDFTVEFFIPSCIGADGGYGIFYYVIPELLQRRMKEKALKPLSYVIYGNVSLFIQQLKTLIIFIFVLAIVFPSLICAEPPNTIFCILLHIAFVLGNLLISGSLISRFKLDSVTKQKQNKTLYSLGLNPKEIHVVNKKQIVYIYTIVWVSTLIYLFSILFTFAIRSHLDSTTAAIILLEFILPYAGSQSIVLYTNRRKNV